MKLYDIMVYRYPYEGKNVKLLLYERGKPNRTILGFLLALLQQSVSFFKKLLSWIAYPFVYLQSKISRNNGPHNHNMDDADIKKVSADLKLAIRQVIQMLNSYSTLTEQTDSKECVDSMCEQYDALNELHSIVKGMRVKIKGIDVINESVWSYYLRCMVSLADKANINLSLETVVQFIENIGNAVSKRGAPELLDLIAAGKFDEWTKIAKESPLRTQKEHHVTQAHATQMIVYAAAIGHIISQIIKIRVPQICQQQTRGETRWQFNSTEQWDRFFENVHRDLEEHRRVAQDLGRTLASARAIARFAESLKQKLEVQNIAAGTNRFTGTSIIGSAQRGQGVYKQS